MADRFVLTLVNNRMLRPEDFQVQDSGAVLLSDEGRRKFLKTWQERKRDTLTHPYLGEKLKLGHGPLCAGAAVGPLPPRRLGRLSAVFMEVMLCWC